MTATRSLAPASAERRGSKERIGTAAVYVAGGIVYYLLREMGGLDFTASPLLYGLMLLVACRFRPRLLASAVLMLVWGAAVLVDGKGPFPADRTAPFFMAAFGLGAGILLLLRGRIEPRVALESIAAVMTTAGVWFYFVHDIPMLEKTWLWTGYFLLYAAGLLVGEWYIRRVNQPA